MIMPLKLKSITDAAFNSTSLHLFQTFAQKELHDEDQAVLNFYTFCASLSSEQKIKAHKIASACTQVIKKSKLGSLLSEARSIFGCHFSNFVACALHDRLTHNISTDLKSVSSAKNEKIENEYTACFHMAKSARDACKILQITCVARTCFKADVQFLSELLSLKFASDGTNYFHQSPLSIACRQTCNEIGALECVKLLLQSGANPESLNVHALNERSPFFEALAFSNYSICNYLLDFGVRPFDHKNFQDLMKEFHLPQNIYLRCLAMKESTELENVTIALLPHKKKPNLSL